jgi:hypothetical protein
MDAVKGDEGRYWRRAETVTLRGRTQETVVYELDDVDDRDDTDDSEGAEGVENIDEIGDRVGSDEA